MIGDLSKFDSGIVQAIQRGQHLTSQNTRLVFTVAANYGGRWDIMQAIQKMMAQSNGAALESFDFEEEDLSQYLALNYAPEPDLFIRTGGECRISNFYCGNWPIRNYISPILYGLISMRKNWIMPFSPIRNVSGVLGAPVNNCKLSLLQKDSHKLHVENACIDCYRYIAFVFACSVLLPRYFLGSFDAGIDGSWRA